MSNKLVTQHHSQPISDLPRRFVGLGMALGTGLWVPLSLTMFEFGLLDFLALSLIALGLYELFSTGLVSVLRSAVPLTLGIGLQLLAFELITFSEFLLYWPLAFITFGVIVLVTDVYEDRRYNRYRHA